MTEPFTTVADACAVTPFGPVGALIVTVGCPVYPEPPISTWMVLIL